MKNKKTTDFLGKFKNTMVMVKLKETGLESEPYYLLMEDYDEDCNILFRWYGENGELNWFIPFGSILYLKETNLSSEEYIRRLKARTVNY
jgi:hypothetical protein